MCLVDRAHRCIPCNVGRCRGVLGKAELESSGDCPGEYFITYGCRLSGLYSRAIVESGPEYARSAQAGDRGNVYGKGEIYRPAGDGAAEAQAGAFAQPAKCNAVALRSGHAWHREIAGTHCDESPRLGGAHVRPSQSLRRDLASQVGAWVVAGPAATGGIGEGLIIGQRIDGRGERANEGQGE